MSEDAAMRGLSPGDVIGGRYRIEGPLSEGGMGMVYFARHTRLEKPRYAVKILLPQFADRADHVRRLEREAQTQATLDHPNVVPLIDLVEERGQVFLVLSFVAGGTLGDVIERAQKEAAQSKEGRYALPVETAVDYILQVLSATNAAHMKGILHCDLKPSNVMLDEEQRVRVTDFGIARNVSDGQREMTVIGTPAYMSPEQITDPQNVDHRADVFSCGVLLFELLTGQLPYPDRGPDGDPYPQRSTTAYNVRQFRPDVPASLAHVVAIALQTDRAQRWQGAQAFGEALLAEARRRKWRRTWLPAIAVTAALLSVGGFGAYEWKQALKQQDAAREREAGKAAIENGMQQFAQLCNAEAQALKIQALVDAQDNDSSKAEVLANLRRRIEDHRQNEATHARNYSAALAATAKLPTDVAEALLAEKETSDTLRAAALQTLRSDLAADRASANAATRDAQTLRARCPR